MALAALSACDCYLTGEGTVTDAATHAPLQGVHVGGARHETWTDASGHYKLDVGVTGCPPPQLDVEFAASGYKTLTIRGSGDVALEPVGTASTAAAATDGQITAR